MAVQVTSLWRLIKRLQHPNFLAGLASVGLHIALFSTLQANASRDVEIDTPRSVDVVELSEADLQRLPDFARSSAALSLQDPFPSNLTSPRSSQTNPPPLSSLPNFPSSPSSSFPSQGFEDFSTPALPYDWILPPPPIDWSATLPVPPTLPDPVPIAGSLPSAPSALQIPVSPNPSPTPSLKPDSRETQPQPQASPDPNSLTRVQPNPSPSELPTPSSASGNAADLVPQASPTPTSPTQPSPSSTPVAQATPSSQQVAANELQALLDQYADLYAYNPSGTGVGDATGKLQAWLSEVRSVTGDPQLFPRQEGTTATFPDPICPNVAATVAVLVGEYGVVRGDLIRSTGYDVLDQVAKDAAKGSSPAASDAPYDAYLYEVNFSDSNGICRIDSAMGSGSGQG